jgi:hypothetical protein
MVVALLALFVALGGTGYAAVKLKNNSVPGKKLKRNTVTGKQVKESTLGTVPRAQNANLLGGQAVGAFLAKDGTAVNSQKLGGLARTSFVRRECDVDTGQIKGVVTVTASATFPSAFTAVPGYNCSGQPIDVRRLSMGRYEVRFNGNPGTAAIMTPRETGVLTHESGVFPEGAGLFQANTATSTTFADVSFTFIVL